MSTTEQVKGELPISAPLAGNEDCETVYLKEDEIESFLQRYLQENPDCEVETHFVNPAETEYTQEIQVRWLRPETPTEEIPPIIIREIPQPTVDTKPLRIVELPDKNKVVADRPPIVIREQPPTLNNVEKKVIYVPPGGASTAQNNAQLTIERQLKQYEDVQRQRRASSRTASFTETYANHAFSDKNYRDILKAIPLDEIMKYVDDQKKASQPQPVNISHISHQTSGLNLNDITKRFDSGVTSFTVSNTAKHEYKNSNCEVLNENIRVEGSVLRVKEPQPVQQQSYNYQVQDSFQKQMYDEWSRQEKQQSQQEIKQVKQVQLPVLHVTSAAQSQNVPVYDTTYKTEVKYEPNYNYDYSAYLYADSQKPSTDIYGSSSAATTSSSSYATSSYGTTQTTLTNNSQNANTSMSVLSAT